MQKASAIHDLQSWTLMFGSLGAETPVGYTTLDQSKQPRSVALWAAPVIKKPRRM